MVNHCVNPACREEFKVLNAGDLYAHETRSADTEFFWLCSTCVSVHDLRLDPMGRVWLRPRGDQVQPPHPDGYLRLVSRVIKPNGRLHAMPSGERSASQMFVVGPLPDVFRARAARPTEPGEEDPVRTSPLPIL
jgi:hypothetical protein